MKSIVYGDYTEKQLEELLSSINYLNGGYPTSNCLAKGYKDNIFFKKLNKNKIKKLFNGDYILLFDEYYRIIKQLIKINRIYGISIDDNADIYEFSELLEESKFLDNGNTFEWNEILLLFKRILFEINNCVRYNCSSEEKIGFETAIWNFNIDGILFDLDPPKILKLNEDTTFTRKDDIHHIKRTLYRSFDEIGMKVNLLVTLILGQKHNSFIVKNQPDNYIEILIDKMMRSFTSEEVKNKFLINLVNGVSTEELFVDHPIEILRSEIMKIKKMSDKTFVFVAGTSESGKSGGINYIKDNYPSVQHIKIRDVFPKVYEDTFSNLSFEKWQDYEETRDLNNFWRLFVLKVYEMADESSQIIILDTMYGVDGMVELYNILGSRVNLLYIDAPFEQRVVREYNRLRTDSINGTRKADLSITMEDVVERTIKKDKKKNRKGADKLPKLSYSADGLTLELNETGNTFATIINNDGTIEEFYAKLDEYINAKLVPTDDCSRKLTK